MDWITILGVLKSAIDIVKSIPEVQKAGQHVVDQINKLIGKGGGKAPQGPLATLIEGQAKRLKTLVDEFASKDADPRFDNIEKAAFRRRVARRSGRAARPSRTACRTMMRCWHSSILPPSPPETRPRGWAYGQNIRGQEGSCRDRQPDPANAQCARRDLGSACQAAQLHLA
jgi:hypothetical protein